MAAVDENEGLLCIGDEFALQAIPNEKGVTGFVSANQTDGSVYCDFLTDGGKGTVHPPRPLFSRFVLHPANQYTASRNLQKFDARITTDNDEDEQARLREANAAEAAVNKTELELATGQVALFGSTYQLFNRSSRKYLQAQKNISVEDPTALRCMMVDATSRSKMPWFSIQPGFRTRTEGENIRMGDTVVLQSMKMPGMYVHTNIDEDGRDVAEVNIFDRATRFRVVPVKKYTDVVKQVTAGVVCGGDYVELFQRQTRTYLHRNREGRPLCYDTIDDILLDDAELPSTDLRADLLWQLNMPTMQWCGKAATHVARNETVFSLRDGLSGEFLREDSDGSLAFQESDDDATCQWKLIPFEDNTAEYITEATQFYIENVASGNRLCKGPSVADSDDDDTYKGRKYHLVCAEVSAVQEDNLFIFRSLPPAWVQAFFDTMQMLDVLKRYTRDIKAAVNAIKKDLSRSEKTQLRIERIRQRYLLPDSDVKSDSPWTGPVLRVLEYLLVNLTFSSNNNLMLRDGIVNAPLQSQLHETGLATFLLDDLLPAQFELVSPEDIQSCKFGPYFLRVTQYVYRTVCMMAKESTLGSRLIFTRLDDIAQYMGGDFDFKVAITITMAFRGDEQLMRDCAVEFIERMWKLGTSVKAQRFVMFLDTILSVDGAPLKFNQDRVCKIIKENNVPGLFGIDFKLEAANTPATTNLAENNQVRFHIGLVQMAASLCAGRHRESIDFLLTETSLSYGVVLDRLMDASIPAEARICYAKLMRNLFVDREPFELHSPVQVSRIMPPLPGSAKEIEDRLGVPPPVPVDPYESLQGVEQPTAGFADLKDGIFTILGRQTEIRAKNVRHNEFLAEVVGLAHNLLLFGMYDNGFVPGKHDDGVLTLGPEAIELGSKLLLLLDGRRDNMAGLDSDGTDVPMRFRTDLLETNVLMTLKKVILALMIDLFGLRSSAKIELLIHAVVSSKAKPPVPTFEDESPTQETFNPLASSAAEKRESSVARFTSEELAVVTAAMEEANKVRVYKGEADMELLKGALLDMLRYTGDLDLCFGAFNALVYLISQNFVFAQTLRKVYVLGSTELARNYLVAGQQVSEFRRLRKWLHLEKETQRCIVVTKQLLEWCETPTGQDLLRSLNLDVYLTRVLKMRMPTESFPELLKTCMKLVAQFCKRNTANQEIFAKDMESILLKLLYEPQYYGDGAAMLTDVVDENEHLSIVFSPKLVAAVGELALSEQHGRKIGLLIMLEQLLVVEDQPVTSSQVSICKGAMVSRKLIETEGKILEDEWGYGPRMERLEAIQVATADEDAPDKQRAQLGCDYYFKCLEILGICARGKMPTTELLCASMLPFEECISRMHELYNDATLRACADRHADLDPTARSKAAMFAFFREVFVDTNSEHILRSLRRPSNGLWVVEETVDAAKNQAIVKHIVDELRRLAIKQSPLPRGELRDYLYEQVCMFFIQYSRVVAPSQTAKEETQIIQGYFAEVGEIVMHAADDPTTSPRELVILKQLASCCQDYCAGIAPAKASEAEQELAAATRTAKMLPPMSANAKAWERFVDAAVSTVPVRTLHGSDRLVGRGMLELAALAWKDAVDVDADGQQVVLGKYASFMVGPLHKRVLALKTQPSATDDVPTLLQVLDTIRAIPYAATAYDDEKLTEAFCKFAEVAPLDCRVSPDLAAVQKEMVQQGWAMLALEVLAAPTLSGLHLVCLRMLLALTGGGNVDVQDALFEQLTDTTAFPVELFSHVCRALLRLSLLDLKKQRKVIEALKNGTPAPQEAAGPKGFAYETFTFMANCCMGSHKNMQNYIRNPINHVENIDVIADAVNYLMMLERDLKDAVIEESEHVYRHTNDTGAGGEEWVDGNASSERKPTGYDMNPALQCADAAFSLLRGLSSGPNLENQQATAASDIFACVNRVMSYCEYTSVDDVSEAGDTNNTAKGRLLSHVSYVLLALLEGIPDPVVVRRMTSAVDWTHFARHLKVLRVLMDEGVLAADDDNDAATGKKGKKLKMPKGIAVPRTTSDPKSDRSAKWLQTESFRFYTILEKLRIAGEFLESGPDPADDDILGPMAPVFTDFETQNFFKERVGQAEVVRNEALERLFFALPHNTRKKKQARMIHSSIKSVMDSCPRDDAGEKLETFLEGAYEIVLNIESQDTAAKVSGERLPRFFAWCARVSPTMYISAIISVICCVSLDKSPGISGSSMDPATFGRWSEGAVSGYEAFLFFASLHIVITVLRTYAFFRIRFPILKSMYTRSAKLDYLRTDQGLVESSFLDCSVVIYGLPYELDGNVVDQKSVSKLLSKFGFVTVARVVPVVPEEGLLGSNPVTGGWRSENNSFALVTFAREQGVKNVIAAQTTGGGVLKIRNMNLTAVDVTEEYVSQSGTLSKLVDGAELEMLYQRADPLYVLATNGQRIVNLLGIGRFFPIVTAYVFRNDPELRESALDIGASLLGFFYSPLAFTFHLFKITKMNGAAIVVTSMTHNVGRLSVTIMLCLLFAWVFAIFGLLYFQEFHMDGTPGHSPNAVSNHGGPCPNLLTCFMSYSYAGLMQAGVGGYLTGNVFPVLGQDVWTLEFVKTLWEVVFSMIAMFVVSIITGIICDTFGELRGEIDEAAGYRASTNFITGIPYAEIPEEKSTHYLQYTYLLLYLQRRSETELTPLERMVKEKVDNGEIDWIPDGRCLSQEGQNSMGNAMNLAVASLQQQVSEIQTALVGMAEQVGQLAYQLDSRGTDV